jgi:hypothetical protein
LARTYALESLQTIRRVMLLLNEPAGTAKGPDKPLAFPHRALLRGCPPRGARDGLLARLARADRTDG